MSAGNGANAANAALLKKPGRHKAWLNMILVLAVLVASYYKTDASIVTFFQNWDQFTAILYEMVPPDWSYTSTIIKPMLETLRMAIVGTTVGAVLAIPIALLASRNVTKSPLLYYPARFILNLLRSVPELLYATLFVTIFGFGPVAGILALVFFSFGIVSKLLYESVEAIDPGPLEAMTAVGANKIQWIHFGVVPQVAAQFVSYFLYTFEVNVRASAVLGMVGAGGVGHLIDLTLNQFRYGKTAMIIVVTFVAVVLIDYASNKIREKLL